MPITKQQQSNTAQSCKKGEGRSLYTHQMRNTETLKLQNGIIDIVNKTSCSGECIVALELYSSMSSFCPF